MKFTVILFVVLFDAVPKAIWPIGTSVAHEYAKPPGSLLFGNHMKSSNVHSSDMNKFKLYRNKRDKLQNVPKAVGLEKDTDDPDSLFRPLDELKAMRPGPGVQWRDEMPVLGKENGGDLRRKKRSKERSTQTQMNDTDVVSDDYTENRVQETSFNVRRKGYGVQPRTNSARLNENVNNNNRDEEKSQSAETQSTRDKLNLSDTEKVDPVEIPNILSEVGNLTKKLQLLRAFNYANVSTKKQAVHYTAFPTGFKGVGYNIKKYQTKLKHRNMRATGSNVHLNENKNTSVSLDSDQWWTKRLDYMDIANPPKDRKHLEEMNNTHTANSEKWSHQRRAAVPHRGLSPEDNPSPVPAKLQTYHLQQTVQIEHPTGSRPDKRQSNRVTSSENKDGDWLKNELMLIEIESRALKHKAAQLHNKLIEANFNWKQDESENNAAVLQERRSQNSASHHKHHFGETHSKLHRRVETERLEPWDTKIKRTQTSEHKIEKIHYIPDYVGPHSINNRGDDISDVVYRLENDMSDLKSRLNSKSEKQSYFVRTPYEYVKTDQYRDTNYNDRNTIRDKRDVVNIEQNAARDKRDVVNIEQNAARDTGDVVNIEQNAARDTGDVVNISPNTTRITGDVFNIAQKSAADKSDVANVKPNTADDKREVASTTPNTTVGERDVSIITPNTTGGDRDVSIITPNTTGGDRDVSIITPNTADGNGDVAIITPNTAGGDRDVASIKSDTAGGGRDVANLKSDTTRYETDAVDHNREMYNKLYKLVLRNGDFRNGHQIKPQDGQIYLCSMYVQCSRPKNANSLAKFFQTRKSHNRMENRPYRKAGTRSSSIFKTKWRNIYPNNEKGDGPTNVAASLESDQGENPLFTTSIFKRNSIPNSVPIGAIITQMYVRRYAPFWTIVSSDAVSYNESTKNSNGNREAYHSTQLHSPQMKPRARNVNHAHLQLNSAKSNGAVSSSHPNSVPRWTEQHRLSTFTSVPGGRSQPREDHYYNKGIHIAAAIKEKFEDTKNAHKLRSLLSPIEFLNNKQFIYKFILRNSSAHPEYYERQLRGIYNSYKENRQIKTNSASLSQYQIYDSVLEDFPKRTGFDSNASFSRFLTFIRSAAQQVPCLESKKDYILSKQSSMHGRSYMPVWFYLYPSQHIRYQQWRLLKSRSHFEIRKKSKLATNEHIWNLIKKMLSNYKDSQNIQNTFWTLFRDVKQVIDREGKKPVSYLQLPQPSYRISVPILCNGHVHLNSLILAQVRNLTDITSSKIYKRKLYMNKTRPKRNIALETSIPDPETEKEISMKEDLKELFKKFPITNSEITMNAKLNMANQAEVVSTDIGQYIMEMNKDVKPILSGQNTGNRMSTTNRLRRHVHAANGHYTPNEWWSNHGSWLSGRQFQTTVRYGENIKSTHAIQNDPMATSGFKIEWMSNNMKDFEKKKSLLGYMRQNLTTGKLIEISNSLNNNNSSSSSSSSISSSSSSSGGGGGGGSSSSSNNNNNNNESIQQRNYYRLRNSNWILRPKGNGNNPIKQTAETSYELANQATDKNTEAVSHVRNAEGYITSPYSTSQRNYLHLSENTSFMNHPTTIFPTIFNVDPHVSYTTDTRNVQEIITDDNKSKDESEDEMKNTDRIYRDADRQPNLPPNLTVEESYKISFESHKAEILETLNRSGIERIDGMGSVDSTNLNTFRDNISSHINITSEIDGKQTSLADYSDDNANIDETSQTAGDGLEDLSMEDSNDGEERVDDSEASNDIQIVVQGHKAESKDEFAFIEKEDASKPAEYQYTWSEWGECSVTCGIGQRFRSNRCGNSQPCTGENASSETEVCSITEAC